jgi:hypothetical protein
MRRGGWQIPASPALLALPDLLRYRPGFPAGSSRVLTLPYPDNSVIYPSKAVKRWAGSCCSNDANAGVATQPLVTWLPGV